jgi:apolipoprotein N-acyltransferase
MTRQSSHKPGLRGQQTKPEQYGQSAGRAKPYNLSHPVTGLTVLSGLLTAYSFSQLNQVLIWGAFAALFIAVLKGGQLLPANRKKAKQDYKTAACQGAKTGALFGAVIGLCLFNWMVAGAARFTGNSSLYGWIAYLLSTVILAISFASLVATISLVVLRRRATGTDKNLRFVFLNALAVASLYCLWESALCSVSSGFPWFNFIAGLPLAKNIYLIQPTSLTGQSGLSFMVILINFLLAECLLNKSWQLGLLSLGNIFLYFCIGYGMLQAFNKRAVTPVIKIALLSENISPATKWDDHTGNALAQRLLDLSKKAAQAKPGLALWSESAIPWTYSKNDDLVNAILQNTASAHITHLLGINTATADMRIVHNSVYSILPDAQVIGRYDKQTLLSVIEDSFLGLAMPFRSSDGFMAVSSKENSPLPTPYGQAGILICNESTDPKLAYKAVQKGAQFLCNLSNDGWFSHTYLMPMHFYHARLRAVSCRKDLAINSNMGYCGLIQASGAIQLKQKSAAPRVYQVDVSPNQIKPFISRYPHLPLYFYALLLLTVLCIPFTAIKKGI